MSDEAREAALAHFGVKGMKWGVRKSEPSGGGGGVNSKHPPKAVNLKDRVHKIRNTKRTPAEQAAYERRVKISKDVGKAVAIAAGTTAVGMVAGPLAAAGAGAIAKALTSGVFTTETTTHTYTTDQYGHVWESTEVKKG